MAPSASVYSQLALHFFDFVVLTHIRESMHLEIGAGTGYYPTASSARLAKGVKLVSLLDLNPNTLVYARKRLADAGYRRDIETVHHDVFDALPETLRGRYDSVALVYLFHCLSGTFPKKATNVFKTTVPTLAEGGVLRKGIFDDAQDTVEGLREALEQTFEEYELRVVGVVALFTARRTKI
ncbi:hypothetical protein ACG7TL_008322 [Trametes sanguinea]